MARRKNLTIIIISFLTIVLFTACKAEEEAAGAKEATDSAEQSNEENLEETEDKENTLDDENLPYTFPLTGEKTAEQTDMRPFGVMIENSAAARPQSGLYQADIVYEVLTEATITRFLAFYHSAQPEVIGPVRSARDYYLQLNNGYDAVYVSAGGSPDALAQIEQGVVDHISGLHYDGTYFTRSSERKAPHNMYTSYSALEEAFGKTGYESDYNFPELTFTDSLGEGSSDSLSAAEEVEVVYGSASNNVQFKYDNEAERYFRYNGGQASEDLETGNPVAPKNVFIVAAPHKVIDDQGRRAIDLSGNGKGYLIQEGLLQEVDWENRDNQIIPVKDGNAVPFLSGQTWINIIPDEEGGLETYVNIID
ncbi:DUF3048 domain-containing protein [Evansella sp. LMS18]|uniref:DUF3048 domain-containing protein n=1 Tax=Evansella sp. LMS18 TaxID=2924033 RepID=UPI0020D1EEFD|nr:DUF3048 domain-containing protein [Evansella sp. LMS18]UTR08826.1 DUF3048 domain-containing protein [Evansella sp. LMS18]